MISVQNNAASGTLSVVGMHLAAALRRHHDACEHRGDVQRHLGRDTRAHLGFAHHSLLGDPHARPTVTRGCAGAGWQPAFSGHTKSAVLSGTFIGGLVFDLLPLALLWLAFSLVYLLVPHTKINFNAALVGGIVGGTLWHLNSIFGFLYVIAYQEQQQVYGGLGLVPAVHGGACISRG